MSDDYNLIAETEARSRRENERIRTDRMVRGLPVSILNRVIDRQCEQEACGRSLGQNVDTYVARESKGKPTRIIGRVIYQQIRRLFQRK